MAHDWENIIIEGFHRSLTYIEIIKILFETYFAQSPIDFSIHLLVFLDQWGYQWSDIHSSSRAETEDLAIQS